MKLLNAVAFSNGNVLLTLKKPPPLVPSCLIAICDAAGPRASVCSKPWTVVYVTEPVSVWITPCDIRISAPAIDRGSRM